MAGRRFALAWGWCAVIAMGWNAGAAPAVAQERIEIESEGALPLPLQSGARWLRMTLLGPLQQARAANEEFKTDEPKTEGPNTEEPSPQVRTIEGIRERIGGSVLKGTLFEGKPAMDSAEFRRLCAEWEREWMAREAHGTHDVPGITGQGVRAPNYAPQHLHAPVQYAEPLDPVLAAAEELRSSARNLDALAADLEDGGKYKEADRLRASAQKLRREARILDR